MPHIARKLRLLHAIPAACAPTLWPTIIGWYDMAASLTFDDQRKQEQFSMLDLAAMRREVRPNS
jgi:hypothetical protein